MKVRIFLAVLAAVVAAICAYVFKPELIESVKHYFVGSEVESPPMERLTDFVDARADRIFAPLDSNDAWMPAQEIKSIREDLVELGATSTGNARQMYATAVLLCDMILEAVSARAEQTQRLDRLENSKIQASLATPENRDDAIREKRAYFLKGILSTWERVAKEHRDVLRVQYGKLRDLELLVIQEADASRQSR